MVASLVIREQLNGDRHPIKSRSGLLAASTSGEQAPEPRRPREGQTPCHRIRVAVGNTRPATRSSRVIRRRFRTGYFLVPSAISYRVDTRAMSATNPAPTTQARQSLLIGREGGPMLPAGVIRLHRHTVCLHMESFENLKL